MSGDVQPRRRKDKRKKKEEPSEETTVHAQPPPTPILANDDVNIHVHKERTLGGGICAKSVFFLLMIIISVIIGFTITEHRGQTDVDIPVSESRFASIFEGWTDKSPDDHDEGDDMHGGHLEEEEDDDEEEASEEHDDEISEEELEESDETGETAEEESQEEDAEEESQEEDAEDLVESDEAVEEDEEDELEDDDSEDQTVESEETEEDIAAEESEPQEVSEEDEEEEEEEEEVEFKDDDDHQQEMDDETQSGENTEQEEQEKDETESNDHKEEPEEPDEEADLQDDEDIDANFITEDENPDLSTTDSIKSGDNAAESESDKDEPTSRESTKSKSGAQNAYEYDNITNAYDYEYRDDLDEAQKHLNKNVQVALSLFTKILERHPDSPRGLYGRAKALDLLAEQKRSNEILQDSIQNYLKILNADEIPDVLFLEAGERCINRMRFIGNYARAISVHKKLINRFPNESKYANDLSVTYLTINRIPEARSLLIDILRRWPNNGFALVHYGFILKTVDNELNKAIDYLQKGIRTREAGVIDGRFYFHLGDALARLGKRNEAMQVYEDGVTNKVFLSKYQRSLYNVERLTARPWWEKVQTPYNHLYRQLEQNYKKIREEALSVLNVKGYFKDESENLRDIGDWKQFELYARGIKHAENCKRCPLTCKIIDSEPDAKSCRRGQVKFSVMHPGTHVWPHCGPTNCRLRVHLGLKVPSNTYIRVAEETRSWKEGEIFIFDDSFEHEVWHNGTEFRLVLIIDVWHPELTKSEKYNLSAI